MEDGENTSYLADGFRNVDKQSDITKFRACLTFIDSLPSFQSYKAEAEALGVSRSTVYFEASAEPLREGET